MAHIEVSKELPGIIGLLEKYSDTAEPLRLLAERLLRVETPALSKSDRETIAAYISNLNKCVFCSESHAGVADAYFGIPGASKVAWTDESNSKLGERLVVYLKIAKQVQAVPTNVNEKDVRRAKELGASDREIHDVVLIAAAFCMFNRYVDGLGTTAPPRGDQSYLEMGKVLASEGYIR